MNLNEHPVTHMPATLQSGDLLHVRIAANGTSWKETEPHGLEAMTLTRGRCVSLVQPWRDARAPAAEHPQRA